jgi:hypothetical protein
VIRRPFRRLFWAIEDRYGRWGFLVPTSDGDGWTRIQFFTAARANGARLALSKCGKIPGFGLVRKR